MGIQKETCAWCDMPFQVMVEEPRERYNCLECGNILVVIKEPSLDSYPLELAEMEFFDYKRAQEEGLKINDDALEICRQRIDRLRREMDR